MDLKNLKTFQTIAEEGSFSKAADKLGYTQSTITFQMGQLEEELSATLFEKIGRKMCLTKAGKQILPYVEEVLQSVRKLKYFDRDISECSDDIRIGIAESQLCYRMPDILKKFHAKAPKARLFLSSMNCYEIRDELIGGTLDLGIFYDYVGGISSQLTVQPCGTYDLSLVSSPEMGEKYNDFITPGQVIPVPFIIDEQNCVFRQIFEKYIAEKEIVLDHTIELWSIPTIKNLVMSNMGISFLPKFTVQQELDTGQLVEIPTEVSTRQINAVCGYHKNKWISPLMDFFISLCSESCI